MTFGSAPTKFLLEWFDHRSFRACLEIGDKFSKLYMLTFLLSGYARLQVQNYEKGELSVTSCQYHVRLNQSHIYQFCVTLN